MNKYKENMYIILYVYYYIMYTYILLHANIIYAY